MKKYLNKVLSSILALSVVLSLPTIAFAAESDADRHLDSVIEYQNEELADAQLAFENMSIEELNSFIDTTIDRINQRGSGAEIDSVTGQRVYNLIGPSFGNNKVCLF